MALEGTLRDFSLADIFQLIGLQKKTGILTLRSQREEARILFMNGMVVGADTNSRKLEDHLGHVLVKTHRITQEELEEVLVIQSHTLQRLGQVLIQKGFIQPEDLRDALQVQTTQIIYRLFRWSDGEYHFQQERYVDYDQENFQPITAESILMEGVRMLDEWPMIEKLIPNFDVLLEKTPKGKLVQTSSGKSFSLDDRVGDSFDTLLEDVLSDGSGDTSFEMEDEGLDRQQEMILQLIDGPTVVQEVIDRSGMNEFETCRVLYDLINMGYVRRAVTHDESSKVKVIEEEHHLPDWVPVVLIVVIALIGFVLGWNPLNQHMVAPWRWEQSSGHQLSAMMARLDMVSQAIDRYYAREGSLPPTLGMLARENLVAEEALRDNRGRFFQYKPALDTDSYELHGFEPDGSRSESLNLRKSYGEGPPSAN